MSFSFIHVADLHLDSPLSGLELYDGAPVDQIRGATRRALVKLVELAIEKKVAFIVIAGDVYDGDWRDYNTGLYFLSTLKPLADAGIRVYLISGNHDAQSVLTKSLPYPETIVRLSTTKPQTIKLPEFDVAIHGQGFADRETFENLCKSYPRAVDGMLNIGLLHTCADDNGSHQRYAPCSIDDMKAHGYHYWALGHVHTARVLSTDPFIVFPGNIQGRHVRETGPKGCSVVEVDDGKITSVTHHDLDVFRWQKAAVNLAGRKTQDEAIEAAGDVLRQVLESNPLHPLAVRVEFTGPPDLHAKFLEQSDQWTNELRATASSLDGQIWLEKIKFRPLPEEVFQSDSQDTIVEITKLLGQMKIDGTLRAEVATNLLELSNKLPASLKDAVEELNLENPEQLAVLLDDVERMIVPRLQGRGS